MRPIIEVIMKKKFVDSPLLLTGFISKLTVFTRNVLMRVQRSVKVITPMLLALGLSLFSCQALAIKIILLIPTVPDTPFWELTIDVAKAAAEDLNVELDVRYGGIDRYNNLAMIKEISDAKEKADYVIFLPLNGNLRSAFKMLNDAKINFITLESNLTQSDLTFFNSSANELSYWVGQIYYDDKQAGSLLAEYLIKTAKEKNFPNISITALSGDYSEISSKREAGLLTQIDTTISLNQIFKTMWDVKRLKIMMPNIILRYPNNSIFWTASDIISNSVHDYLISNKLNNNTLIGGVGWLPEVYNKIKNGDINASVGGHFLQGAWAIVKAYDHHQGIKGQHSTKIQYEIMHQHNINEFTFVKKGFNWDQVDFREYSVFLNKDRKQHNFQFDFRLAQPEKPIKRTVN